jgi:hypothetical protein
MLLRGKMPIARLGERRRRRRGGVISGARVRSPKSQDSTYIMRQTSISLIQRIDGWEVRLQQKKWRRNNKNDRPIATVCQHNRKYPTIIFPSKAASTTVALGEPAERHSPSLRFFLYGGKPPNPQPRCARSRWVIELFSLRTAEH